MMNKFNYCFLVSVLINYIALSSSFIPYNSFTKLISGVNQRYELGEVSSTLTHQEIIKRGILQSVAKYFYDQPNGNVKVNLSKMNEYYDVANLYYDYYGEWYCDTDLEDLIEGVFSRNVAAVDVDSDTKDLPYAHFDGETFEGSNERVINLTDVVYAYLTVKDYRPARKYSGQVLHTIQDFYSHSNWVELGYTVINSDIGTPQFMEKYLFAGENESTCLDNCVNVTVDCSSFLLNLVGLGELIGLDYSAVSCPMTYFICNNTLIFSEKLTSGYYGSSILPNGTRVVKYDSKCSHGGVFDKDAKEYPEGGINKDAGYYFLSPRADLHLTAANLAVDHTEYFFNQIRTKIGDTEYSNFLELTPKRANKNRFGNKKEKPARC